MECSEQFWLLYIIWIMELLPTVSSRPSFLGAGDQEGTLKNHLPFLLMLFEVAPHLLQISYVLWYVLLRTCHRVACDDCPASSHDSNDWWRTSCMPESRIPQVRWELTVHTSLCMQPYAQLCDWFTPFTCISCPQCFENSSVTTGPLRALVKYTEIYRHFRK